MSAVRDYSIKDVEKVVKGIDGEIKNVSVTRLTAPGDNFVSLVFRVDFEVEKDGKTKILNTVGKRLPIGKHLDMLKFNAFVMKNEIRWYSEIVPILKEFGKEYGIDADLYPEYVGSRYSMDPETKEADEESVLLLKNLFPEGYKNEDRLTGFDLISTHALLRVLATFHALPIALKFKKPELWKFLKDYLHSCQMESTPEGPDGSGGPDGDKPPPPIEGLLFDQLIRLPKLQPYLSEFQKFKEKPKKPQWWDKPGIEPWNTIVHRDYWVNNVMVKPREGLEPLVKILDFQFPNYSSYAKDLVFFLLTSVRDDIQEQHFDDLLRYYYDQLTSILEKFDIPELKLTYEDYLEEVKRVALETEVSHAIIFSTIVFSTKGTAPDILTGELDMMGHLNNTIKNMSDRHKEKLQVIIPLIAQKGWF